MYRKMIAEVAKDKEINIILAAIVFFVTEEEAEELYTPDDQSVPRKHIKAGDTSDCALHHRRHIALFRLYSISACRGFNCIFG